MTIEQLTDFFMWASIINIALMVFSTIVIIMVRPMYHRGHAKLFGVEPETINSTMYCYLAGYKMLTLVFFVVPWIALAIIS